MSNNYYITEIDGKKIKIIEFIERFYLEAPAQKFEESGYGDGIRSCIVCDYLLHNDDCDIQIIYTDPNPYKFGDFFTVKCCCKRCAFIYENA